MELASKATADLMNTAIFPISGPEQSLAEYLGATGRHAGVCLLRNFIPIGYRKPIFPMTDAEAASKPLVKNKYNSQLHLAIGMLRIFDATQNTPVAGGEPFCDFHSSTLECMKGAGALPPYGPLFFEMAREILPKLCPHHRRFIQQSTYP
jgi:hypothetical protein